MLPDVYCRGSGSPGEIGSKGAPTEVPHKSQVSLQLALIDKQLSAMYIELIVVNKQQISAST